MLTLMEKQTVRSLVDLILFNQQQVPIMYNLCKGKIINKDIDLLLETAAKLCRDEDYIFKLSSLIDSLDLDDDTKMIFKLGVFRYNEETK